MSEFIMRNIQMVGVLVGVVAAGVYALFGLTRIPDGDDDTRLAYKPGHKRRALTLLAGLLLIAGTVGFVPAGHRGVVYDAGAGVLEDERPEGLTLMVPFWQRLHNVTVRTQVYEYESYVQTKDLQEVTLPLAINYHVDPERASQLYQEVGFGYVDTIIQPAAFQGSTQAAGQIQAIDIAQSRAELSESIRGIITPKLERHGVTVEFVSVKDAVFDPEFIAQIKANEVALQRIVESQRLVTVAQNDAAATVQTATGDAEAERVRGAGIADANAAIDESLTPAVLLWKRLAQWNGELPDTVVGDDGDLILTLP